MITYDLNGCFFFFSSFVPPTYFVAPAKLICIHCQSFMCWRHRKSLVRTRQKKKNFAKITMCGTKHARCMGRSLDTERNVSTLLIRKHVRKQLTVYSDSICADTSKRPQENERERRIRRSSARFQLLPFSSLPSFFILRGKSVPRLLLRAHLSA